MGPVIVESRPGKDERERLCFSSFLLYFVYFLLLSAPILTDQKEKKRRY